MSTRTNRWDRHGPHIPAQVILAKSPELPHSKYLQSSSSRAPIRTGSTQQSPDVPRPARRLEPWPALQLIFRSFVMSSAVRLLRSVPDVLPKRDRSSIFKSFVMSSAAPLPRSIPYVSAKRDRSFIFQSFVMSSAVPVSCSVPYFSTKRQRDRSSHQLDLQVGRNESSIHLSAGTGGTASRRHVDASVETLA